MPPGTAHRVGAWGGARGESTGQIRPRRARERAPPPAPPAEPPRSARSGGMSPCGMSHVPTVPGSYRYMNSPLSSMSTVTRRCLTVSVWNVDGVRVSAQRNTQSTDPVPRSSHDSYWHRPQEATSLLPPASASCRHSLKAHHVRGCTRARCLSFDEEFRH